MLQPEFSFKKKHLKLAKHYTQPEYALDICKFLNTLKIKFKKNSVVFDPAVGNADLLKAASSILEINNIKLLGADIAPEEDLDFPVIYGNAFTKFNNGEKIADILLTNPPFGRKNHPKLDKKCQFGMSRHFIDLMQKLRLRHSECPPETMELAFLGLSLTVTKKNGICALILPESIFTCKNYQNFRKAFQEKFSILGIKELPRNAFSLSQASVSTCVLVFKNSKPKSQKYTITFCNKINETKSYTLSKGLWHPDKDIDNIPIPLHLNDLPWEPLETISSNLLIKSGFKGKQPKTFSHKKNSSDAIYVSSKDISMNEISYENVKFITLEKNLERTICSLGDVLIVRSGMGCLGKMCIVEDTKTKIVPRSEVYRLSGLSSVLAQRVILSNQIASIGSRLPFWTESLGRGVGTPNLNLVELKKIPILNLPLYKLRKILKDKIELTKEIAA